MTNDCVHEKIDSPKTKGRFRHHFGASFTIPNGGKIVNIQILDLCIINFCISRLLHNNFNDFPFNMQIKQIETELIDSVEMFDYS